MSSQPVIFRGNLLVGDNDFVPDQVASQFGIHNMEPDGGNSFGIKVNNSSNSWLLAPGEKLGLRFKNKVIKITLTPVSGTPAYQIVID